MYSEKQILAPIDFDTYRSCFARDKSRFDPVDSLTHFAPLIQNFERLNMGRYFWFIVDFPEWEHCAAGGDVENLTPFSTSEFSQMNQSLLHAATYPEDTHKVLTFSRLWVDFYEKYGYRAMRDFSMSLIFRMMNAKREFYWIMVQYPDALFDDHGKMVYSLVLVTDISHIRHDGVAMMNVVNHKDHTSRQFLCMGEDVSSHMEITLPSLTRREEEILRLLAKGHGSKQIASLLHLSVKTVDNHRQNMLHKTGSSSSSELVGLCIRTGII